MVSMKNEFAIYIKARTQLINKIRTLSEKQIELNKEIQNLDMVHLQYVSIEQSKLNGE